MPQTTSVPAESQTNLLLETQTHTTMLVLTTLLLSASLGLALAIQKTGDKLIPSFVRQRLVWDWIWPLLLIFAFVCVLSSQLIAYKQHLYHPRHHDYDSPTSKKTRQGTATRQPIQTRSSKGRTHRQQRRRRKQQTTGSFRSRQTGTNQHPQETESPSIPKGFSYFNNLISSLPDI